jgi:NAD(P)-dependent dehydrogenase (short-subunit alcohol dehydrogenase family)
VTDLSGRVSLVTGGSRGIGRAIASALANAGSTVVIASRHLASCEEAAIEIAKASGAAAVGLSCHVGRWNDCDRLVEDVYRLFGRCDVLVNNAGVSPRYEDLASVTEDYYDKITAVNVKGAFRISALIGQRMAEGDGGSIINVSTIGSLRPGSGELVYAMAKAALNALTIGLAEAYAPSVRANAILPGVVATDISRAWTPDEVGRFTAAIPVGRLGRPEDFAEAAVWLAGPGASYVNGALIRVDGGQYRQTS